VLPHICNKEKKARLERQDRTCITGHEEQDRQNKTGRTGQAEWDRRNWTGKKVQAEWDIQNGTIRTGQKAERDIQNRTDRKQWQYRTAERTGLQDKQN
jgi:hypothetical protein